MALIVLEGLDRTGKTTVAQYYESLGYELIHMSAPPKGMTADQYLQEMVDLVSSASTKNIVLDRSHYGELVWSSVYGRSPLISEEDLSTLREIEDVVGTMRIMMHDPNVDAHWKRCTDNNEPLNKMQFVKARSLYANVANKYGFELVTLPQFFSSHPEAKTEENKLSTSVISIIDAPDVKGEGISSKTPEQLKLEKANAINDVLSKRILKYKGDMYDELEKDLRDFLNSRLGKLLGDRSDIELSSEEVKFYKAMYKKATQKGEKR
jgi:hypothetical protein